MDNRPDPLADLSSDDAIEMVKLMVAGKMASTPPADRVRFVLELSQQMVGSLSKTIEDLRQENADLQAEVAQLRQE